MSENDNYKSRIALKYEVTRGMYRNIEAAVQSRVLNGMLAGADTLILEKESDELWKVTTYINGEEVWTEDETPREDILLEKEEENPESTTDKDRNDEA